MSASQSSTAPATTLNWGIIGTGAIGQTFARSLAHSQTGRLQAVGSRSREKADSFAGEFSVPTAHGSYEALLADPEVQAVYISTPHPEHAPWVIAAAEAGKHVLCEKPIGLNHAEAMAMIAAAREHNVFLMEAFMYRCHPQTHKLLELIRQGAIGEVRVSHAAFSFNAGFNPESRLFANALGGGGILDVGCYTASISRLVAGAALGRPFAEPVAFKGVGHLVETGVDGWAVASLKFDNDIVAQIATGVQVNQSSALRIYGSEGSIIVHRPYVHERKGGGRYVIELTRGRGGKPEEIVIETDRPAFSYEADVVAEAIAAGRTEAEAPAMTWDDMLGNMAALDRWRREIGLTYEMEKPEKVTHTVSRKPLRPRTSHNMRYGRIEGLEKPVSRLVMGVDNQTEMPQAAVMFDDYIERGGNTFDTAYVYRGGICEGILGQWVRNRGVRDEVVLLGKGAHTPHCDPVSLTRQLHETLERMGVDTLDIYMMHRDNLDVPVGEFVDVLNEHKRAGRIGIFGGSNWTIERFEQANAYAQKHGLEPMRVLSNNLSLARMIEPVWAGCLAASEPTMRQWHEQTGTPLMPWSSQARGFFTERAGPDKRDDASLVRCWYSEENFERRRRAIELAEKLGALPIQIALAYVLCQRFPTFPLIGPRTLDETRTSLPALDIDLTPEQCAWLDLRDG